MWTALQSVTSGISLVAFLAACVLFFVRRRLSEKVELIQSVPETERADLVRCGVKTTAVPWAGKHSRFTLMFEPFAIEVSLACGNVKSAAGLLDVDWNSLHRMMERAVERGLACRELESLQYVGIDEKSFRRGHSYVSILTDLTGRRVLEVVEDRTEEAADGLWKSLTDKQKTQIEAVAVDMWPATSQHHRNQRLASGNCA